MNNETADMTLPYFDRMIGSLAGKPDVVKTKATTMREIKLFGLGTNVYVLQTFRRREDGDWIFLEYIDNNNTVRVVIPPKVADAIARQRDQLTKKSRSRAGVLRAEDMKERGVKFGFEKK